MTRKTAILLFAALATITSCKPKPSLEDQANHMLELGVAPTATPKLWENAGTLECRASKMDVCGAQGCITSMTETFIRLTPSDGSYQRCDSKGCDSYKAAVRYSGIWTTMTLPDNATLARITGDHQFVEVATSNDVFYLYRGSCKDKH